MLLLLIPAARLLFRYVVAERMGTIILSALVAHTGVALDDRAWERPAAVPIRVAGDDAALLAGAMRWTAAILLLAGVLWMLFRLLSPARGAQRPEPGNTV